MIPASIVRVSNIRRRHLGMAVLSTVPGEIEKRKWVVERNEWVECANFFEKLEERKREPSKNGRGRSVNQTVCGVEQRKFTFR